MRIPTFVRRALHAALATAVLVACSNVQAAAPLAAPAARAFSSDAVMVYVRHLAGEVGPRPAGSESGRVAADYIAAQFADYGYAVERQSFTFPQFEERGTSLAIASLGSSDSTGDLSIGGAHAMFYSGSANVTGPLRLAGFGRPEDFAPRSLAGTVALIERGADVTFRDKAERAAAAGAAAAVIYNSAPREFTGSLQVQQAIPVVSVGGEDGRRLRDLLQQGPTIVRVAVDASVAERTTENVVATQAADAPPGRTLVLGAHYDSVEISPGANDNASGTAMVLELAHVLAGESAGARVTFATFGGEELGLLGSAAYVQGLSEEGRHAVTGMLNFDMVGVGDELRIGGYYAIFLLAQQSAQRRCWQLWRLGGTYNQRSDQASFLRAAIPAVFFYVSDDPHYHTPTDVPENLSLQRLQQIGEVALDVVRQLVRS